jgi:hypothetical protein
MNIWFMFDNHAFAKLGDAQTPRADMEAKAAELFAEDGGGSLFARMSQGSESIHCHGKRLPGGAGWGATPAMLREFFDAVDERVNWIARG